MKMKICVIRMHYGKTGFFLDGTVTVFLGM